MVRPALDHYVGQKVEEVGDADENSAWSILFEGGARVYNVSDKEELKEIPAVVGMSLASVTLSETDTKMFFGPDDEQGTVVVELDPINYSISAPDAEGPPVFPQRADEMSAEKTLPPDPSSERIKDGPTEPKADSEGEPVQEEAPKRAERASKTTKEARRGTRKG
jgi:hypothetical protein